MFSNKDGIIRPQSAVSLVSQTAAFRIHSQSPFGFTGNSVITLDTRSALYAVSVIKTVECPSVRLSAPPSVCSVDRQQQRRPAGLLLRSGAGSRYRSIAAAATRHAGCVNFGPTVRRSNIRCSFIYLNVFHKTGSYQASLLLAQYRVSH